MSNAKVRLVDQVTSELQNMIFNRYSPGDRLPVENELAQMFSASRITIREAVSRLSAMGIVDVRQGDGTFVKQLSPSSFMQPILPMLALSNVDLIEVFDVRILIESYAAQLAAEKISKDDLKCLKQILESMEHASLAGDTKQYNDLDVLFHKEIARYSGNQVISVICEIITDMIKESIFYSCQTLSQVLSSIIYHNRIFNAINEHNGPLAAEMMREHLGGGLSFAQESNKQQESESSELEL